MTSGAIFGDHRYSAQKKAYKHLSGYRQVHPSFRWLWASSYQNKHKVFWLLLHDRLSTREILRRKSMNLPSYNCVLCNQGCEESLEHLFLRCRFAKDWWASIGLSTPQQLNPEQTIEHFKSSLGVPFFVEIIVIMSWSIWKSRNSLIFEGMQASITSCRLLFCKEFALVILRAKDSYSPS